MAKNNVFHKLPAQVLLQDSSVTFSGCLERKISLLKIKHWIKCYVVISSGNIYIYTNYFSIKPSVVCILRAFQQIQIIKNRTQPPFWVFVLKPIIDSVPELKFAAASEREMDSWICEFKAGILYSKNSQLQKSSQPLIKQSKNTMEASIYSNLSERNNVTKSLLLSDPSSIYEETESIMFSSNFAAPSAPPLYPSICQLDRLSLQPDIDDENVLFPIFIGTREEAFAELSKCVHLGSYLVREDNDRQILTVKCENKIVKYCLLVNSKTKRISIAGEKESFQHLYHLLSYYHEHSLPNRNCKLLIPYKGYYT